MPEQTATTEPRAAANNIRPFEIEFGDDNCRTITIACLRRKVRGAWSLATLHRREIGGRDVGSVMSAMPDIPGLRLRIDPRESMAEIYDPLEEQPELVEKINGVAKRATAIRATGSEFKFVPRTESPLNPDQLVTLIIEARRHVEEGSAKLVGQSKLPSDAQIAALPGRQLFDPWNSSATKPRYADQFEDWVQEIERRG